MNTQSPDPTMLLNLHRAYWQRANQTALVSKMPQPYWGGKPYPLRGRDITEPTRITPDDVDLDRLLGLERPLPDWAQGDMIESVGNMFPTAWMEALIGCSIHASAYGCVAKSPGVDLHTAARNFSVTAALESEWFDVMVRLLARAEQAAQGQLAVRQWHMRGVVDMLAAYLGESLLCTAVYDAPDDLRMLGAKFAQVWIAVAQKGVELRKQWHAGFVSAWRVYAPAPVIDYQIDASSLFAVKMYAQQFLDADRQVLSAFPYSLCHTHAIGLRHVKSLVTIPELRGIEIHLDRETGVWEKDFILATCRMIQQHNKTIVIWGELTPDELDEFQNALEPGGLAINYWEPTQV